MPWNNLGLICFLGAGIRQVQVIKIFSASGKKIRTSVMGHDHDQLFFDHNPKLVINHKKKLVNDKTLFDF